MSRPDPPGTDAEGETGGSAGSAARVWCGTCLTPRPLRRIYPWPALGGWFGECAECGSTISVPEPVAARNGNLRAPEEERRDG